MKLTIQIKLLPNTEQADALLASIKAMNEAATYAARIGFDHRVYGQISIHRLCYYKLRELFGLPAQMAVRAIGKAVEVFKRDKSICPVFDPLGAVPLDSASYRLIKSCIASIGTIKGRYKIPYVVGDYFRGLLTRRMGQADLVYRDNKFYLYITIEFEEPPPIEPKHWLGVDLGIVNIATDSFLGKYSGEQIQHNRRRRATARKQYQRKGTRNAKRRLKKMAGRQSRFQRQTNHSIAKKLVNKAKTLNTGIVLENLKNIRSRIEPTASKRFRRTFGNWNFARLRSCIEYKAKRIGIPVKVINPAYSSQTCSNCGYCDKKNRPDQARFHCLQCHYSTNADRNAALNLSAWAVPKPAPKATGKRRPLTKPSCQTSRF